MFKIFTVIIATLFLAACQSTTSSNQVEQADIKTADVCVPEEYENLEGDLNFSVSFDCSVNTMVLENLSNNEYQCSIYYSNIRVKSYLNAYESVGFQILSENPGEVKEYHCDLVENEALVSVTKQKMITANGTELDLQDVLSISCDSDDELGNTACETVETVETYPIDEPTVEQELKEDTI